MSSDDDHYLDSYLSEILPTIGLDVETYAPYVTGYVSHKSLFLCLYYFLHESPNLKPWCFMFQADDNSDDDDGESLDELIELLRASSESHVDDDDVWDKFRKEISQRRHDYRAGEEMRKVCYDGRMIVYIALYYAYLILSFICS